MSALKRARERMVADREWEYPATDPNVGLKDALYAQMKERFGADFTKRWFS